MLLWLTEYLSQYIGGFSVFQYLTLRTMVSVITALAVSLVIGPSMIAWLGRSQIGQQVRDDGPTSHFSKAGTRLTRDGGRHHPKVTSRAIKECGKRCCA